MKKRFEKVICFNCKEEMSLVKFDNCNDYFCKKCKIIVTVSQLKERI